MDPTEPMLTFPVIRGVQARREYYVAMWSLRLMRQVSIFNEDELPPELRAQRILNKARIPEIAGYILDNPDDYVFSALTVSIDSDVLFEPLAGQDDVPQLMDAMPMSLVDRLLPVAKRLNHMGEKALEQEKNE